MTELGHRSTTRWPGLFDVPAGPRTAISAAVARRLFRAVADRFDVAVVTPGTAYDGPTPTQADRPTIVLSRPEEFHARIGRDGLIGFGEGYMTGAWDSPDLARLLTVLATEMGTLVPERLQRMRRWYVARIPHHHRGSVDNSQANIAHHYDLSNELFRAFLDPSLTYSSALFEASADRTADGLGTLRVASAPDHPAGGDLPAAQARKIERLLDVTGVGEDTRVLEIGTGWGELALRAARRGAQVRTVTLSREQQDLARERIAAAGLADRVDVELTDYRRVRGNFDAVVSVEMIEAVGHDFLPTYFRTIHDRLAPGGRAAIQAIVMPHDRMLATLGTYTWIHKYIFPGGFLPSVELLGEVTGDCGLRITDRLSFGSHYAETLRMWDEAFLAADLPRLGFDDVFRRMWHFYLTYSRAGFAAGYLDVQQIVLEKERR